MCLSNIYIYIYIYIYIKNMYLYINIFLKKSVHPVITAMAL